MQTESNVTPVLHPPQDVQSAISSGDLDSRVLLEAIAALASEAMWRQLWLVADSLSREVSVLFDRDDRIWVDIGTAGLVRLSPPVGATIPFSLWIHTHPWDAYWSSTDLATLASYSQILDKALVLGHDHMKATSKAEGECERLGTNLPLSVWTSEKVRTYNEVEV
ncbi:MAG: hypothetical protein CXT66_06985 [Methanobacteriota archaeon]|nr:MAG: hypothetical protein CXT66_06985 [Euryarchaeota archaeon]